MPEKVLIEELWKNRIAPTLRLDGEATLRQVPEGYGTQVYFVCCAGRDYVLRLYQARSLSRLRNYLQANLYLRKIGFVAPKPIGEGREPHLAWLLEEKIQGRNYRDLLNQPADLVKAAESLARLHSHERNRYGEVGTWGGFSLTLRWRQRFSERWSKIIRLFPELKPVQPDVESWFQTWTDTHPPSNYQLLHGDFHPGNLCLLDDGNVAFLDLRTPRFGFGLLELIEALHHFMGEDPVDWSLFLNSYLESRQGQAKRLYEGQGEAFHAIFHLRHTDRFADLAVGDRGDHADRRRWERNAWDSWRRFTQIAQIDSPPCETVGESAFSTSLSASFEESSID